MVASNTAPYTTELSKQSNVQTINLTCCIHANWSWVDVSRSSDGQSSRTLDHEGLHRICGYNVLLLFVAAM